MPFIHCFLHAWARMLKISLPASKPACSFIEIKLSTSICTAKPLSEPLLMRAVSKSNCASRSDARLSSSKNACFSAGLTEPATISPHDAAMRRILTSAGIYSPYLLRIWYEERMLSFLFDMIDSISAAHRTRSSSYMSVMIFPTAAENCEPGKS